MDDVNTPDEAIDSIESLGSEAFLTGVDDREIVEPKEEVRVDADKPEQTDQVKEADQTEIAKDKAQGADEPQSESERNAFFAQRRIAAKQNNDKFVESLREETAEFVNEVDESKFENMDEEQAEILKNAQRQSRQMEVNEAIRETERSRESTANSIFQAESQLPAFNSNDKEHYVGDELYGEAMSDWAAAHAIIELDKSGQPQVVGVKKGAPSPYEFLEQKAKKFTAYADKLQARAQSNVARNNAAHEIVPVQKSSNADSFEELEERVGNISLA